MKIDLQLHSDFSDGKLTPTEIVIKAKQGGLKMLSLTDHDSVIGIEEASQEAHKQNLIFIPGVEFSTIYLGKIIHILGYKIDIHNSKLQQLCKAILEYRKNIILDAIPDINIELEKTGKPKIDTDDIQSQIQYFGKPRVADYLIKNGQAENSPAAFALLKNVKMDGLEVSPKEAIDTIHEAGGLAIMSHPFAPKISLREITNDPKELEEHILTLVKDGLDGLEVFQASHYKEDQDLALEIAKKHNLLFSGGSDWHGPLVPEMEGIKEYIPNYLNDFTDFDIPEPYASKILTTFGP